MKKLDYNGQAEQDKFVCNVLNNKINGFFVEVGSNHPIKINNTYVLENTLKWTGLMFEYERAKFEKLYKEHRSNSSYIFGDAQSHDYQELFSKYNVPNEIDYLQLDIDPPEKTLNVLKVLNEQVMTSYKFAVITFEHDYSHCRNMNPRNESRKILKDRGYYLVFEDIANQEPKWVYEDWYVHPDLVDMDYIKKLQSNNEANYGPFFADIPKTLNWENIEYYDKFKSKLCGITES
tara:strand:+ start:755 stop:1456 length:702 start_codon:yes stop_codon:yes gene_type:complete